MPTPPIETAYLGIERFPPSRCIDGSQRIIAVCFCMMKGSHTQKHTLHMYKSQHRALMYFDTSRRILVAKEYGYKQCRGYKVSTHTHA